MSQRDLFEPRGMPQHLYDALVSLARDLLLRRGALGGGFDEVRVMAETRGLLTGHETGRFLSAGDGIMRAARGKRGKTLTHRRSLHPNSHRRRVAVHVHGDFVDQIKAGAA